MVLENSTKIGMTCENFENKETTFFQGPYRLLTNIILNKYINSHKSIAYNFSVRCVHQRNVKLDRCLKDMGAPPSALSKMAT